MRRFHLLSFIVAMLVASGLLWLNIRERIEEEPGYLGLIRNCGWPLTVVSQVGYRRPQASASSWREHLKSASIENKSFRTMPDGSLILYDKDLKIRKSAAVVDFLVLLAAAALALFACESFLRRRESRAHASRRSTPP